jgi:hypothetical protein
VALSTSHPSIDFFVRRFSLVTLHMLMGIQAYRTAWQCRTLSTNALQAQIIHNNPTYNLHTVAGASLQEWPRIVISPNIRRKCGTSAIQAFSPTLIPRATFDL